MGPEKAPQPRARLALKERKFLSLTGLFGYFGGAFAANIAIGAAVDHFGWNGGFWLLFGSCLVSVGLFVVVWRLEMRDV